MKASTQSLLCLSAGSALKFAVQTAISPVSGGRLGVAKAVVMLVMDKSADAVPEAANEALAAGQAYATDVIKMCDKCILLICLSIHTHIQE